MAYTILVTGGRDYDDYERLCSALHCCEAVDERQITAIIHGGNGLPRGWRTMQRPALLCKLRKGADALAHRFAIEHGIAVFVKEAKWGEHGRAAGPMRNSEMAALVSGLQFKRCVAFPGGAGTADMVRKVEALNGAIPLTTVSGAA